MAVADTVDLLNAAAADLFDKLDWPTPEDESWRRTPLQRLLPKGSLDAAAGRPRRNPVEVDDHPRPLLPDNYAARIITEGGIPAAVAVSDDAAAAGLAVEWADAADLPAGLSDAGRAELQDSPDRITAWHWRDMPGSLIIHLPPNTVLDTPVVVEERLVADSVDCETPIATISHPHLHIEAGTSSALEVIWSLEGAPCNPGTPLINAGLSAEADANAVVGITVRQRLGRRTALFVHNRLSVERDARIEFRESHLGGAMVKSRTRAVLNAEGADARLKGLYIGGEGRHLDIGTLQEHRSPRTTSDALYKGAVHPGGRTVFGGLIEVAPKAAKTDAYLTNNNLILGDGARADSIPQLNILTDDVKCSHGSTTGKLDDVQQFYLQARGYSPVEARRALTRGFLSEVIDGVPAAVAEILAEDLDAALAD